MLNIRKALAFLAAISAIDFCNGAPTETLPKLRYKQVPIMEALQEMSKTAVKQPRQAKQSNLMESVLVIHPKAGLGETFRISENAVAQAEKQAEETQVKEAKVDASDKVAEIEMEDTDEEIEDIIEAIKTKPSVPIELEEEEIIGVSPPEISFPQPPFPLFQAPLLGNLDPQYEPLPIFFIPQASNSDTRFDLFNPAIGSAGFFPAQIGSSGIYTPLGSSVTRSSGSSKKTGTKNTSGSGLGTLGNIDTGKLVIGLGAGYLLYNHIKQQQQQQQQQAYYNNYYRPPQPTYYPQPSPTYYPTPSYSTGPSYSSAPSYNNRPYSGAGSFYGRTEEPQHIVVPVPTYVGNELRYKRSSRQKRTAAAFEESIAADTNADVKYDEKTPEIGPLQTTGDPTKNVRITFHPMREEAIFRMGLDALEARQNKNKLPSTGALVLGGLAAYGLYNAIKPKPPTYQTHHFPQNYNSPSYSSYPQPTYSHSTPTTYYPGYSSPTTTSTSYPSYSSPTTTSTSFPTYSSPTTTTTYFSSPSSYQTVYQNSPYGRSDTDSNAQALTFGYFPIETQEGTILPIVLKK